MTEYLIAKSNDYCPSAGQAIEMLEREINDLLIQGWRLTESGGITVLPPIRDTEVFYFPCREMMRQPAAKLGGRNGFSRSGTCRHGGPSMRFAQLFSRLIVSLWVGIIGTVLRTGDYLSGIGSHIKEKGMVK